MSDSKHITNVGSKLAAYPSPQSANSNTLNQSAYLSNKGVEEAADLLKRLFRSFNGSVTFRLWNGTVLKFGSLALDALQFDSRKHDVSKLNDLKHNNPTLGNVNPDDPEPAFTLVCRNPNVIRSMVLGRDPLRMADAYFRGDIDIEGDFFAAVSLKDHLNIIRMSLLDRLGTLFSAVRLPEVDETQLAIDTSQPSKYRHPVTYQRAIKAHSKTENRDAIHFHYDVSNEFYALWLDKNMIYSCAYFEQPDVTLEKAQLAKLDHICRKLLLKPGDHFLDIGCGWGALVIHAAKHYGVQAHGITLSQQQLELARRRIADAGLEGKVTVELRDYRDLDGDAKYDKIASIGMFEHVGLKNLPIYFSTVHRLLKPTGLFLNHGITHDIEGWNKTLSTEFINRYIFPDGQLDTISNIQRVMERSKFEIADVEALRPHYALTLRQWVARLEQHHEEALQYVNESTYRIWRLYMATCALEFESGEIGVYQVLANKRAIGNNVLPLTRRHLY
ncbi:MAG: cyclopropane-fatty-acyl-phospholipid synthase family protein [Methylotenera sp.]